MAHCLEFGDEQSLQDTRRKLLEYEIMLLALERTARSDLLDDTLRKKLLFLMSDSQKELENMTERNGGIINFLGLSQQMISQLPMIDFKSLEKKKIESVFKKELHKVIKEISDCLDEFDLEITSEPDIWKAVQDLQKTEMDVNADVLNLTECQKKLLDLQYKTILGKQMKNADVTESVLVSTLQTARELYNKTMNAVYPSKEYYDKINEAALSLEKELIETNKELEELQLAREKYRNLDQQEFKSIAKEYKDILLEIKMKEMALKEVKQVSNIEMGERNIQVQDETSECTEHQL